MYVYAYPQPRELTDLIDDKYALFIIIDGINLKIVLSPQMSNHETHDSTWLEKSIYSSYFHDDITSSKLYNLYIIYSRILLQWIKSVLFLKTLLEKRIPLVMYVAPGKHFFNTFQIVSEFFRKSWIYVSHHRYNDHNNHPYIWWACLQGSVKRHM